MLKEQLDVEHESHAREMSRALGHQAEQLDSKWSNELELKLSKQETLYQAEIARARARLGALESMVERITSAGT